MIDPRYVFVFCGVFLLVSFPDVSHAEIAGRYKIKGQSVNVKIQSWGENCGPRPRSSSGGGGKVVRVSRVGAHLAVGHQRTDRCWSRNPKVVRKRASAGTNRWTSSCATPAGDPRSEQGEYTLQQLDEKTLRFREVSRYDWRLEGDHCKATVFLTRTYARIADDGTTEPPDTKTKTEPDPQLPTKQKVKCSEQRGDPTRIEIRPKRARVEPGSKRCFRAIGRDDQGCQVPLDVTFSLEGGQNSTDQGTLGNDGCFVAGSPKRGRRRVVVYATAGKLKARAPIIIRRQVISDLIASRLAEGGDEIDDFDDSPTIEARAGAAQGVGQTRVDPARGDQNVFLIVLVLGLIAVVIFGAIIVVIFRRKRKSFEEDEDFEDAHPVMSAAPSPVVLPNEEEKGEQNLICPKCRRGYEGGETHCSVDSEKLLPYSEWRDQQMRAQKGGDLTESVMICPKCGEKYDHDVRFCQKDGAKLEPLN